MTDQEWSSALKALLRGVGIPESDIEEAESAGALVALFADTVFLEGDERLTRHEVADRAGIDFADARAFWRALGFADVPDDARIFTEADVEVLKRVSLLLRSGFIDRELALQMTRVMGRAAAQVAAAQIDTVRKVLDPSSLQQLPAVLAAVPGLVDDLEKWLMHVFRRHFVAEIKRAALQMESTEPGVAVVGFADLVGFTGISQQLDEETLASAVAKFESTSVDIVGACGGRVVKMIGDEVMFEAPTVHDGAVIALELVERISEDGTFPDVRVGLAVGPALRNQGDLFGTAPNLASRLVDAAYPGTVVVSDTVHDVLEEEVDFHFKSVRPQSLKGFGRTRFWKMQRAGTVEKRRPWRIPILDDLAETVSQELRSAEGP